MTAAYLLAIVAAALAMDAPQSPAVWRVANGEVMETSLCYGKQRAYLRRQNFNQEHPGQPKGWALASSNSAPIGVRWSTHGRFTWIASINFVMESGIYPLHAECRRLDQSTITSIREQCSPKGDPRWDSPRFTMEPDLTSDVARQVLEQYLPLQATGISLGEGGGWRWDQPKYIAWDLAAKQPLGRGHMYPAPYFAIAAVDDSRAWLLVYSRGVAALIEVAVEEVEYAQAARVAKEEFGGDLHDVAGARWNVVSHKVLGHFETTLANWATAFYVDKAVYFISDNGEIESFKLDGDRVTHAVHKSAPRPLAFLQAQSRVLVVGRAPAAGEYEYAEICHPEQKKTLAADDLNAAMIELARQFQNGP